MTTIIDDSFDLGDFKAEVEENKYGTVRVNGKTEREMLKEYREKYGDEKYKQFKAELEADKQKAQEKLATKQK